MNTKLIEKMLRGKILTGPAKDSTFCENYQGRYNLAVHPLSPQMVQLWIAIIRQAVLDIIHYETDSSSYPVEKDDYNKGVIVCP